MNSSLLSNGFKKFYREGARLTLGRLKGYDCQRSTQLSIAGIRL